MQGKILIIEDSTALAQTYSAYIASSHGRDSDIASTVGAADSLLEKSTYAAILLDLMLDGQSGFNVLRRLRARGDLTPVVVITGDGSAQTAMEAVRAGADDFLTKPISEERLFVTLSNLLSRHADAAPAQVDETGFYDFVGNSTAMRKIYDVISRAAHSRAPVMIVGESGTGKELAARALHTAGNRASGVFEALNCAAIPAHLLESEIFGHSKGAFTGAISNYDGAAARANGGTLFLDEITEMPIDLQAKLLRFVQTGKYRPVGGGQEEGADVRIVSATNRRPLEAIADKKLREDLYYRLNVISLHLPPLRERDQDALNIARALIGRIAREEGRSGIRLDDDACDFILSYPWPGNVRQLENVLRRAVILGHGDEVTESALVSFVASDRSDASTVPAKPSAGDGIDIIRPLAEVEKDAIENAIRICQGNITEASRRLDINPSTIYRKISQWKKSAPSQEPG